MTTENKITIWALAFALLLLVTIRVTTVSVEQHNDALMVEAEAQRLEIKELREAMAAMEQQRRPGQ